MAIDEQRDVCENAQANANVRVAEYDVGLLRSFASNLGLDYDEQTRKRKLALCNAIPAERVTKTRNTTCIGLDEYRVLNLSETNAENEDVDRLAVGRDDSTPRYGNRSLNSEIERIYVATSEPQGTTLSVSSLIDAGEMNDEELVEVGLLSEGNRLLNHSTINPVDKNDQKSVTVEVRLTFDTADN